MFQTGSKFIFTVEQTPWSKYEEDEINLTFTINVIKMKWARARAREREMEEEIRISLAILLTNARSLSLVVDDDERTETRKSIDTIILIFSRWRKEGKQKTLPWRRGGGKKRFFLMLSSFEILEHHQGHSTKGYARFSIDWLKTLMHSRLIDTFVWINDLINKD